MPSVDGEGSNRMYGLESWSWSLFELVEIEMVYKKIYKSRLIQDWIFNFIYI